MLKLLEKVESYEKFIVLIKEIVTNEMTTNNKTLEEILTEVGNQCLEQKLEKQQSVLTQLLIEWPNHEPLSKEKTEKVHDKFLDPLDFIFDYYNAQSDLYNAMTLEIENIIVNTKIRLEKEKEEQLTMEKQKEQEQINGNNTINDQDAPSSPPPPPAKTKPKKPYTLQTMIDDLKAGKNITKNPLSLLRQDFVQKSKEKSMLIGLDKPIYVELVTQVMDKIIHGKDIPTKTQQYKSPFLHPQETLKEFQDSPLIYFEYLTNEIILRISNKLKSHNTLLNMQFLDLAKELITERYIKLHAKMLIEKPNYSDAATKNVLDSWPNDTFYGLKNELKLDSFQSVMYKIIPSAIISSKTPFSQRIRAMRTIIGEIEFLNNQFVLERIEEIKDYLESEYKNADTNLYPLSKNWPLEAQMLANYDHYHFKPLHRHIIWSLETVGHIELNAKIQLLFDPTKILNQILKTRQLELRTINARLFALNKQQFDFDRTGNPNGLLEAIQPLKLATQSTNFLKELLPTKDNLIPLENPYQDEFNLLTNYAIPLPVAKL